MAGEPGRLNVGGRAEAAAAVLLVDDDRDFADSLAALLRLEGYEVEAAYGFDQALAATDRRCPQVALVDIRLGLENGIDLVRALHARHPGLIAVMMTAYATIEVTVAALQAGAYDYLCKPFHTDDLLATLERCLERQRLQAERERAVLALQARNRDLESLNTRLTRVLADVRDLSRAASLEEAARCLLATLIRDLAAVGAAVYLREVERLVRLAASGAASKDPLELPVPGPGLPTDTDASCQPMITDPSDALSPPSDAPGGRLTIPLVDGDEVLGLVVLQPAAGHPFIRQDVEIAQILCSFGAAMMRIMRAREDLQWTETRLRGVVDHSPSAISLADLQGRPILSNNRFSGWFPNGVPNEVFAAPAAAAPPGAPEPPLARGAPAREIEVVSKDDRRLRLLVTRFTVLDDAGRAIGIGTIATDVTERHQAEERLRHAQRMEAVGQLTGGVAHDFNNLLAVVLGNLRLIEETTQNQPELLELVEDALTATQSGVELTARLLAFGRAQPLHPEASDVRELVLSMSRLLGRTLGEDITIELTLAPDLGQVRIDRGQLEASLLNLAINARDAMTSGGRLAIAVDSVSLDADDVSGDLEARPGTYVALSVSDDGIGMTPDVLERAVQPFFTTKAPGQGSGLGLSMVYGFVSQSGGHVRLLSELGRGTTIILYFPIIAATTMTGVPARPAALPELKGSGERVLLVEDQSQVRQLLKRQLIRLDYRVVEVSDARAALREMDREGGFDLLLSDIVLPGEMNGARLGEVASARDPHLGVILTTGYAANVPMEMTNGVRVLRKPIEPEMLARTLRVVIESRRRPPGAPKPKPHSAVGENM